MKNEHTPPLASAEDVRPCAWCGVTISSPGGHHVRLYCGQECKQEAHHYRQSLRQEARKATHFDGDRP